MADIKLNFRDFLEQGLIPDTKESEILLYTYSSTSGDDIKAEGLYYNAKTGYWYKDFFYSSNSDGYVFYLPVRMVATKVGDLYTFKTGAIVKQRSSDEYISKVGKACGLDLNERALAILKGYIKDAPQSVKDKVTVIYDEDGNPIDFLVDEFINTANGILDPNPDIIDWIYDCFNDEFGDVSKTYILNEKDFSEDGNYIILKNENIPDTFSALQQEEILTTSISADQINEVVTDALNLDNEYMKAVKNNDFIRVIVRSAGVGDNAYYINFIGYSVNNGVATFSNGNGSIYVTKCDYEEIFFKYPTEEPRHSRGEKNITLSNTIPVYTEPQDGVYNLYGIPLGSGTTITGTAYDLISASANNKGYTLIDGYTYPPSKLSLPSRISDPPEDDEDPPQSYYPIGQPSPRPTRVKPSIKGGVPKIVDIPSDDTLPDVSGNQPCKGGVNVFKISDTEFNKLSNYLWTTSVLEHIGQIWKNNPMDGIISASEFYFSPIVGSVSHPNLGDLTISSVDVNPITDRYQTLNCGYINLARYWNDARDYQSKVMIYLPFIGVRELDVADVMDTNIFVDYNIDVMTGDVTANISVQRKNGSGQFLTNDGKPDKKVLYMFDGNCTVPIMLTSADRNSFYSNVVGGGVQAVGGIVSAFTGHVASGISSIVSGASNIASAKPDINKCGNLGGNRGAMAYKKPYLIIIRPIPNDPVKRAELLGKPSNKSVRVADVTGYAKFKTIHVDTVGSATDKEKDLLESAFLNGVIL